jgi:hypothetical protein
MVEGGDFVGMFESGDVVGMVEVNMTGNVARFSTTTSEGRW